MAQGLSHGPARFGVFGAQLGAHPETGMGPQLHDETWRPRLLVLLADARDAHRERRTVTTLPMIVASSPGIGA